MSERRPFVTSIARHSPFRAATPEPRPLPRDSWETGDFVVAEVTAANPAPYEIEDHSGRRVEVAPGDRIIGALGQRAATLQVVGDWEAIEPGSAAIDALTVSGVLGRATSVAFGKAQVGRMRYLGHALLGAQKTTMRDSAMSAPEATLEAPIVLLIGTSMEAGKTTTAKLIVRRLRALGLEPAATKLTGVGRYRDVLTMRDAGAGAALDFVDAGLPSTAIPRADYEPALARLLSLLAEAHPGVVVAEAGASPLEPYNGDTVVELLGDRVCCTVLCASDPYAVTGVIEAFGLRPDLIAGRATATSSAIDLVTKLCGIEAINALDPASAPAVDAVLQRCLGARV